jgi:anthranilate synthase component 1
MIFPDRETYRRYAREYTVVPVCREVLADMETPVSVLSRLADRPNAFLLESMEGCETWGRYSFIGVDPEPLLEASHTAAAPHGLEALRSVYHGQRVAPVPHLPRFLGGAVGFLAYEAVNEFERMPQPKAAPGANPCSRFLKADRLVVFDGKRHTMNLVVCTRPGEAASVDEAYDRGLAEIAGMSRLLAKPASAAIEAARRQDGFGSNMERGDFIRMVKRAKEYIFAGDVIQVVLSQRFSAPTEIPPLQLYRALRLLNPSPYTFFIKMGDRALVGSSPEVMVRLTGGRVELRPIAGTRPRGATEQEDRRLADELLADEKERAEHVMLVDLGRNDLGRVSEPGSVQVTEYMVIERYSHVMHLVSHVQGVTRRDVDAYDVVRATFPAGTLSGAPKIRAMEIIHELEPGPRGVYGGAVGYVGYDGNMDLAITIRTMEVRGGRVHVQAGAGIVYDSDPDREYEETCHKARALQRAVALAAAGLDLGVLEP